MKKIYSSSAILILVSIFAASIIAQTPQYYNSNTGNAGGNNFPFGMGAGKAVNWLIAAGDLSHPTPVPEGAYITKVYFRSATVGTPTYNNLHILMAQSTITGLTFGVFYPGPWDTVYFHPITPIPTTSIDGWVGIDLDHAYSYDPAKSLILFVGQCGFTGSGFVLHQSSYAGIKRVWSVGGCPYVPYTVNSDGMVADFGVDVTFVDINQYDLQSFDLSQNYPNPFDQSTTISYQLNENCDVLLKVFDIMGKEITTLVNSNQTAGKYEVNFDTSELPAGIYIYKMTTNNFSLSKRMILQKI